MSIRLLIPTLINQSKGTSADQYISTVGSGLYCLASLLLSEDVLRSSSSINMMSSFQQCEKTFSSVILSHLCLLPNVIYHKMLLGGCFIKSSEHLPYRYTWSLLSVLCGVPAAYSYTFELFVCYSVL